MAANALVVGLILAYRLINITMIKMTSVVTTQIEFIKAILPN